MDERELLKAFKKANWDPEEIEIFAFLAAEENPSVKVIVQMLEILCTKRYANDVRSHQRRGAVYSHILEGVEDKQLFLPFISGLKEGDFMVRMMLVKAMPRVNNYAHHPKLCQLLRSKDSEIRKVAADVLKNVGGRTVLDLMGHMVEEQAFPGRSEVIDIVLPVAGHHAVPTLEAIVRAGSPEEKIKALQFLGDPHYMQKTIPEALRVIHTALDDFKESVVRQAILSFCNHCNEDGYFDYISHMLDSFRVPLVVSAIAGLKRFNSPRVIAVFEHKLRSGPNPVRMEVLKSLEYIGTEDILPPLVDAIGHRTMVIRQRASEVLTGLSKSGRVDIAQIVIWLLRSRDATVRRIATDLIQTIHDPEGTLWPRLISFLRDEDWWVRERVMDALIGMAGKKLTPYLVQYLSDKFDVVRRFAIDALIRLEDVTCIGALMDAARNDDDWWTREKAIEGIAAIGDRRAIPFVLELANSDQEMQLACIEALKQMKGREAIPDVVRFLESSDRDVRMESLRFLEHFGATQYEPSVSRLVADSDVAVARQAKQILMHWDVELRSDGIDSNKALTVLDQMLAMVASTGADDLILAPDATPFIKRMEKVTPLSEKVLSANDIIAILTPVLSLAQLEQLRGLNDLDFSYEVRSEELRFRANVFHQRGGVGGVFRIIKGEIPDLKNLGLPEVALTFSELHYGLVLFGGPTGSGKSTTLAAIIDDINRNSARHIVSLEDPIEVVHPSLMGLVNQREIGAHTVSFQAALRSTLREDPDVILVGEMRDLDTIRFALTAADTGHLVFGTVHTVSADTTVDRLLNAFPPKEQNQMRSSLANNLKAVVCQNLLKRKDGTGRVLVTEVMLNTDAVANLIRKGQTFQIPSVIATSQEQGMRLMDNELMQMYRDGIISADLAYMKANQKSNFTDLVNEDEAVPIEPDRDNIIDDDGFVGADNYGGDLSAEESADEGVYEMNDVDYSGGDYNGTS